MDEKSNRIKNVELFYDRGELLGKLVKGEKLEAYYGEDGDKASSCPILKSSG